MNDFLPPFDPDVDERLFMSIIRDFEKIFEKHRIEAKIDRPEQLAILVKFDPKQDIAASILEICLLLNIRGYSFDGHFTTPINLMIKIRGDDLKHPSHPSKHDFDSCINRTV